MTGRTLKKIDQPRFLEIIRSQVDKPELRMKYIEELRKAKKRIGSSHAEVLRWVLIFADNDLNELGLDVLQQSAFEVAYLSIFGGNSKMDPSPYGLLLNDRSESGWSQEVAHRHTLPNRKDLLKLQGEVRRVFDQLIDKGSVAIALPRLTLTIRTTPLDKRGGLLDVNCSHNQEMFLYHLAPCLTSYAGWVRRCEDPDCGRRYLASRQKQRFCCVAHQSRAGTRRYRSKLKEGARLPTGRNRKEKR